VRRQDFSYALPEELIAQEPLAERSASRLLVLDGATGAWTDSHFRELPAWLHPDDLLVFNDTRVVPARLIGAKPSGGRVEVFLERALKGDTALVQLRASKPIRAGLEIATPAGAVQVLSREGDLWCVQLPGPVVEVFERWGEVPLPPYIRRPASEMDRERYQSVFARDRGAVAAPTASLHFDAPLLSELQARGVDRAFVTLHVGAGTFQPLRTEDLDSHSMHSERFSVARSTWEAVERARAAGGRVVAVGTTVVRALESAALEGLQGSGEAEGGGETRLFIRPGFRFRVVDALVTNFHLPESTLLVLVAAFAGREAVLAAYAHAVRERYRFFSYGDAMLVLAAAVKQARSARRERT
jgi:S-adenosylmethionine:tRNA ribosyltransferase-isomerase